ncbi:Na+/H+ antiporter NhaA [Spirosoma sp. RP8]|uniref:Na(+)/H(+) antiporter NhaA n=1 Tax=Spirosoma liriopis TaxID=2937440 RepID=A0ABT0HGV2_9BACT|nr:Na+/H+ antiporter NhaA [Spirosoma liriopis]
MKERVSRHFRLFFKSESSSGSVLFGCVIASLALANSPLGSAFERILAQEIGFTTTHLALRHPILLWINDGLMAVFFLMVGLEIKREVVQGELASFRKAALPVLAALGGVTVPAMIYLLINSGTTTAGGWGIPMATDIAFALAIIRLLGNKVPASLKIFLSALAIADDLAAILVIAIFYSADVHGLYLVYAGGILLLLLTFNRLGLTNLAFYLLPGMVMWYFIHHSGIHATIAGVATAFTIPITQQAAKSPLEKLERALLRPVNFFIIPLFALANTTIRFEQGMIEGLTTPLGIGVVLGLLIGKPLGIFLFSFLSVRTNLCELPTGAHWKHLAGVGILGGIGFTMSIFITFLSFADQPQLQTAAKFAVLTGSVLSGGIGYFSLLVISKK